MNPDFIPYQFRQNKTVAAWLIECWDVGFADGNRLADLLCRGLWSPTDVDDLLRSLRQPEKGELGTLPSVGAVLLGEIDAKLNRE